MSDFFVDHPHSIEIIYLNGKKYIVKKTDDRQIDNLEYLIQRHLYPTGLVPYCFKDSDDNFMEEYVEGELLKNIELNKNTITKIALGLKKIHFADVPKEIKLLLEDEFVAENKYQPEKIWNCLTKDNLKILNDHFEMKNMNDIVNYMNDRINQYKYRMCIIHGDLNSLNMIFSEEKIKIIDWTDARYDLPSLDIAQFFHLNNFSQDQISTFFETYKPDWLDKDMLNLHIIFYLIYDFIVLYKNNKLSETEGIIPKIRKILKEYV